MDRKYKFQSKYEAKIRLIRCYSKQVTFLRCYCKKWKVFSSKLWINVNKTWWKNHHNQGRFYLLYSRERFIVYQKERKNSNGEMKLLSSRLYFQLVTPRQIGPASCQNFSRIQVMCDIVYSIHRLSQSYHKYTWKKVDRTQYKDLWHQAFVPYFHLYFFVGA